MNHFQRIFESVRQSVIGGGILTGAEIDRQVRLGRITISRYDRQNLNPNSYNISIGSTVMLYSNVHVIDLRQSAEELKTEIHKLKLDEGGLLLRPGNLYLVPTREIIGSDFYEPIITGRSSIGRLGISVHQEAGFGDIGFKGCMTLQIRCTYPTAIYPHLRIGQVYFLSPHGAIRSLYNGHYQHSVGPVGSKWVGEDDEDADT